MARVKRAVGSKKRRKQTLERAKGYYGNKSRSVRAANEQVVQRRANSVASGFSASTQHVVCTRSATAVSSTA
jgi:ribosomal protein L20